MKEELDVKKGKIGKKEVTTIEIQYYSKDELQKLSTSEDFVDFIIEDSYKTIRDAIKQKVEKVELFNILNLSLIVELERKNFKRVLNRIIKYYIRYEEYEKCTEIKKIMEKL
jgi:hypothetical protein